MQTQTHSLCRAIALLLAASTVPDAQADIDLLPAGRDRDKALRRETKAIETASERRRREMERPDSSPMAIPWPAEAEVPEGGSVEIPLRAASTGRVEFLLRAPPAHGRIRELRPTGETSAAAIYTHNASATTPDTDAFLFAVRSPDGTISAPVRVEIRIRRNPPRLEWTEPAGFGRVLVGDRSERTIELHNRGGGVVEGTLETDPPWTARPDRFRLPAGARTRITLAFEPLDERTHLGTLRISANVPAPRAIPLRGEGLHPFRAVIEPESARAPRPILRIENRLPRPLTVEIDAPEGLAIDRRIALPAESTRTFPLRKTPQTVTALEGRIALRSPASEVSLPFRIGPDPAQLVAGPDPLDVGELDTGIPETREFRLSNTGGVESKVRIPDHPLLKAQPDRLRVPPGASVPVRLTITPEAPGDLRTSLRIETESGPLELAIAGTVIARSGNAREIATNLRSRTVELPGGDATHPSSPTTEQPASDTTAPRMGTVRVLRRGKTWFEIGWEQVPGAHLYTVEARRLSLDAAKRQVRIEWIPDPGTEPRPDGKGWVARVNHLRPGYTYTLRVVATDVSGHPGHPSPPLTVATLAPWRLRLSALSVLTTVAIVLAVLVGYRRWRATSGTAAAPA